jgi:hypothetical protein
VSAVRTAGRRRALAVSAAAVGLLALWLGGFGSSMHIAAASVGAPAEPIPQTDDSVPAREVTMIGATSQEAGVSGEEVWGVGQTSAGTTLVRYRSQPGGGGEWTLGPELQDEEGQPLAGFVLDTPEALGASSAASPLAAQMAPDGAGAMAGYVQKTRQVVLVREPAGSQSPFQATAPSAESQLEAGERLLSFTRAPLLAPLEEAGGHAGVLIVPVKEANSGVEETVLHWEGARKRWSREPIELPADASATEFRVLGIGAASPEDAWLLAQVSAGHNALFERRVSGVGARWTPVALRAGGEPGEPLEVEGEPLAIPGARDETVRDQVLTVTSQGVWIDGERPEAHASTTIFFQPGSEAGPSIASWCTLEDSPAGTVPCEHALPQALPQGASRSLAWAPAAGASSQPFGERVVTGLPGGVSLRLAGSSFDRVLALGGEAGAAFGAAFANPRDGWLGARNLPVHLTGEPASSDLVPWPVSFRRDLLAIAGQPGVEPGSLSGQALAVGDGGEVARYTPGAGWLPESLVGASGRRLTPRLRAVAWPTAERAYAVGDGGQMWMWRGEAERWEPDPAAPYQFEGNLLGVAFDPQQPAIGYAVGESGVLLSYGKTWTQVQLPAESPCQPETASPSPRCTWSDASFTSVAFAGSEAIVAYRVLPQPDTNRYVGGLLVDNGSGWHVDRAAVEAMGRAVPWATAGLPDGGAAFAAGNQIFEREGTGAPWQATATPFPGLAGPASLQLFREGGQLRAITAGGVPDTYGVERVAEAPPGSPPVQVAPYPLSTDAQAGVLRQTAHGWRDEEHELNDAAEPAGNWSFYDTVYQPDPPSAVLVNATGTQGWAVGGTVEAEEHGGLLDTADVYRLGSESPTPAGEGAAPIALEPNTADFAIAGNAQCAAPCADRANARTGPDVWLGEALRHAHVAGMRAFLYTGPRIVDSKAIAGPQIAADQFSYQRELARYRNILQESPLPVFAAGTPTELDASGSEQPFEEALGAQPLGAEAEGGFQIQSRLAPPSCAGAVECESSYRAFTSSGAGGRVRVILLDYASRNDEVTRGEREWLEAELKQAEAERPALPAIVVGSADLGAQASAGGHPEAGEVVRALIEDHASAYFFDAPEENIRETLRDAKGQVPSFGSGTLGYVNYQAERSGAFLGASGFMLAQVHTSALQPGTNIAQVTVSLIPNIEELAMEARDGTLLRRSQVARFAGLARRPRAGNRSATGGAPQPETDPYIPIPASCVSPVCETEALLPSYTFSSSVERVGYFATPNTSSTEPNAVLLGSDGQPVPDPSSGLFCAESSGITTVTISAGGLSASLPVTVEQGSAGTACGTPPPETVNVTRRAASVPTPAPAGAGPTGAAPTPPLVPPAPPAAAPLPPVHLLAPTPPPAPFLPQLAPAAPLSASVPPPPPAPAEPTPPSGTSPVNSPVEAAQREEESEEAIESARANAAAFSAPEQEPAAPYLLGLLVLAAFAGATVGRRRRGGRAPQRVAPATLSALRNQRSNSRASGSRTRWR